MFKVLSRCSSCSSMTSYQQTALFPTIYTPICVKLCSKKYDSKHKPPKPHVIDKLGRIYYPHLKIFTSERVSLFVKTLSDTEKQQLFSELQKYHESSINTGDLRGNGATVSASQLKWLFLYNCVPFIGFGFLDNAIMIMAGEYIDVTIGITLGISTMAAAALGNLISDLAGLGLAGYVEVLCGRMGLPIPDLSPQQLEHGSSRFASNMGKAVGVAIGCVLGMFPLLFLDAKNEHFED